MTEIYESKLVKRSDGSIQRMMDSGERADNGNHLFVGSEKEAIQKYDEDDKPMFDGEGKPIMEFGLPLLSVPESKLTLEYQTALMEERRQAEADFDQAAIEQAKKMVEGASSNETVTDAPEALDVEERAEIVEDLGEKGTDSAFEHYEIEENTLEPEAEPDQLFKEDVVELARGVGRRVSGAIDGFAQRRGYGEGNDEVKTTLGRYQDKLDILFRDLDNGGDVRMINEALKDLTDKIEGKILQGYEPFSATDLHLIAEQQITKVEEPDDGVRTLMTDVTELATRMDDANNNLRELKGVIYPVVDVLRHQILPLLAQGDRQNAAQLLLEASQRITYAVEQQDGALRNTTQLVMQGLRNLESTQY